MTDYDALAQRTNKQRASQGDGHKRFAARWLDQWRICMNRVESAQARAFRPNTPHNLATDGDGWGSRRAENQSNFGLLKRALARRAGEALGFACANLITLFAPPKVLIYGRAFASSQTLFSALGGASARTLRELYGAAWGTTGPARARERTREAT